MTISSNNNHIQTYLNNDTQVNNTLQRIAAGIENRVSADAASLAISDNLRTDASGIYQSIENTNSALALTQIGDRAFQEQSSILDTVRRDLQQAGTDTTSQDGREALLNNIQSSLEQLNNIASQTNYNGTNLLQASSTDTNASTVQEFQAGNDSQSDIISTTEVQSNTTGLGLEDLLNQDPTTFDAQTAREYLDTVDQALDTLNSYRADYGAASNQLESSSRNLATQYTNTLEARSVLTDIDYAQESADFSKQNILAQVGAIGLAQANNITQQSVSRLLQ